MGQAPGKRAGGERAEARSCAAGLAGRRNPPRGPLFAGHRRAHRPAPVRSHQPAECRGDRGAGHGRQWQDHHWVAPHRLPGLCRCGALPTQAHPGHHVSAGAGDLRIASVAVAGCARSRGADFRSLGRGHVPAHVSRLEQPCGCTRAAHTAAGHAGQVTRGDAQVAGRSPGAAGDGVSGRAAGGPGQPARVVGGDRHLGCVPGPGRCPGDGTGPLGEASAALGQ